MPNKGKSEKCSLLVVEQALVLLLLSETSEAGNRGCSKAGGSKDMHRQGLPHTTIC